MHTAPIARTPLAPTTHGSRPKHMPHANNPVATSHQPLPSKGTHIHTKTPLGLPTRRQPGVRLARARAAHKGDVGRLQSLLMCTPIQMSVSRRV